jgi:replicative DNA helicase
MIKDFSPQESEEAILHILMVLPDRYFSLSSLKSYMFSSIPHSEIFEIIDKETKEKTIIDFHILTELAEASDSIEEKGGREFLEKLRDKEGINPDNIRQYERIVVDAWKTRNVISICSLAPSKIDNIAAIQDVIVNMRKELDKLDENTSTDSVSSLEVIADIVWEQIKEKKGDPGISGISTGLTGLDEKTAGMDGGELWLIAGRPGMGKTATMCNMLLTGAKQDRKGLLFSLEMNKQLLVERLLAINTGIHLYPNIRMGSLDDAQMKEIKESLSIFKHLPIFLDTNFIASLDYLEMMIRKYKHSEDIDIVYIDYIQLLAERDADATQALGRISRRCKLLAEELDIPVVVASQLNRSVEARTDKRPVLSDLRQSGNLEEDADLVLGLYRDKKYNMKTPDPRLVEGIVLKQRNGPTGTVFLDFEEETNILTDKEGFYGKSTKEKGKQMGETISRASEREVEPLF